MSPIRAGVPAPEIALEDADGRTHLLEHHRGRWLLLVFHRHLG